MDFSRATGSAVAWLVLIAFLAIGALHQRLMHSTSNATVAAKQAAPSDGGVVKISTR